MLVNNKEFSLKVSCVDGLVHFSEENSSPIGKRKFDAVENKISDEAIKYDVKKIILIQNTWRSHKLGKEVRSKVFLPREISHHLEPWLRFEYPEKRISEIALFISRVFLEAVYHQKYSCSRNEVHIFPKKEVLSSGKKYKEKEKGFSIKIDWDIILRQPANVLNAYVILHDKPGFGEGSYKCVKRAFYIWTRMKCTTNPVEKHPFLIFLKAYAKHYPIQPAVAVLKKEMESTEIIKSFLLTPECPAKVALWKPVSKYVEGSLCDLEQEAVNGDLITLSEKGIPTEFFPSSNSDTEHLGFETKLKVFIDVLTTLEFFHSKDFGQADVKPENILLKYNKNKKSCNGLLSDFGYSGYFGLLDQKISGPPSNWNNLIKVLNIRTGQTDIFGFGCALGIILLQGFGYRNINEFKSLPEEKLICNEICAYVKGFTPTHLKEWFKDPSILDAKGDDKEKTTLIIDQLEKTSPELRNKLLVKIHIVKILKNLFVKDESLISSFKNHEKEFAKTKDNYDPQVDLSSVIKSWKPDFPTATELKIQLNSLSQLYKGKLPPEELFTYKKVSGVSPAIMEDDSKTEFV